MAKGDILLRVDSAAGPIQGESAADPGAIEVQDWSWGMSATANFSGQAAAGNAPRPTLSELRITKGVDRASTALMNLMRNHMPIKKAVLTVRKSGGGKPVDSLVITIENGLITSLDIANAGPDAPEMVERLSIAFLKIDIAYTAQSAAGGKSAASNFSASVPQR